ncbi:hypothetical protein DVA67_011815 [Solirubrobacter sp. CPCC 204708]|uniref:Uncharacterized protein n=1 Tax=Solirubrobacter deserti TaxID=2282478 RepID=A0ABT4RQ76_9ACTN|nr:hypothetical protein [Solirubrobacter deserti]MBE2316665.1 hypothetical protein [Solirubrobacter deserti]MDA0140563.1 hypothetical protein [Solirubrobacter deserti]
MKLRLSVAAVLAATTFLGVVGSAQAQTISTGHWDVGLEYDCATATFSELHAHNHDTGVEYELADATFAVSGTSNSIWEQQVFGGSALPVKVIGDGGTFRVGFAVEPIGTCSPPSVTFRSVGTPTVPSGLRAAAYRRAETDGSASPRTRIDTVTGSNRNLGIAVSDHEDLRWGFTGTGTYTLNLRAVRTSNNTVLDTQPLTFGVS